MGVEKVMGVIDKFVAPRLEELREDLGESEPLFIVGGVKSGRKIVLKAFILPKQYSDSEVINIMVRIGKNSNTSIRLSEKVIDTVLVSGEEGNVNIAMKCLS